MPRLGADPSAISGGSPGLSTREYGKALEALLTAAVSAAATVVGWALAVAVELSLAIVALRLMATWPPHAPVAILAVTILPVALAQRLTRESGILRTE